MQFPSVLFPNAKSTALQLLEAPQSMLGNPSPGSLGHHGHCPLTHMASFPSKTLASCLFMLYCHWPGKSADTWKRHLYPALQLSDNENMEHTTLKFPQDSDAGGRENPGSARGGTFLLEFQSVRYLTGETRWAIGWWDCALPCLVTA